MNFPDATLLNKVKFDRPIFLANIIDLTADTTVITSMALKPILRFTTPDVYTTVITGFTFGFLGGDIPSITTGGATLNLRFMFLMDLQQNLFNQGMNLSVGGNIGDLTEYATDNTFIEIKPNRDVILGVKDIVTPYSISNPELTVYATVTGYLMTLRREDE